eukprot:scaffold10650_cov85-Skeletonema_dohrnii-CCMP3373.AAC.3
MPHHHSCKKPKPYLIITNISKRQNVRNLIQIGASFGVTTIFVVGQKSFNFDVTNDDGNNNKSSSSDLPTAMIDGIRRGKMTIIRFDKLEECVAHIKNLPCCDTEQQVEDVGNNSIQKSNNSKPTIQIIGVEIDPSSVNLENEPFTNSTAFMMGNEGQGMTKKQMSLVWCCIDSFIGVEEMILNWKAALRTASRACLDQGNTSAEKIVQGSIELHGD